MAFPQSFIDDLRMQADIVQVVQEYVSLRKVGATYKGLCPFHSEKTPSFHVNRDKGFFHCFGCSVGGDVFKFLELQEKMGFQDAVRHLAGKFGLPIPEPVGGAEAKSDAAEREALLKVHEYLGEVNGKLDAVTVNSIMAFQRAHDLEATGILDSKTQRFLQQAAAK